MGANEKIYGGGGGYGYREIRARKWGRGGKGGARRRRPILQFRLKKRLRDYFLGLPQAPVSEKQEAPF